MFEIKSNYNNNRINIYIPPRHKTICVSVSGGTDSALLLWNIFQHQKDTNNAFKVVIYTTAPRTKKYFNFYHALNVQNWIFDYTQFDHDYSWCTFHRYNSQSSEMYTQMKAIGLAYNPTLFISGRTSWPQSGDLPPFWDSNRNDQKISKTEAITYTRNIDDPVMEKLQDADPTARTWFPEDSFYYTPMISVDKKWIRGSYEYYGITDLWNTTRSCEGEQPILQQTCGECWWCLEREWAKT